MFSPKIRRILDAYNTYLYDVEASDAIRADEDFRHADKYHDWRNHIPYGLRDIWAELSEETRTAVFVVAQLEADDEEWE